MGSPPFQLCSPSGGSHTRTQTLRAFQPLLGAPATLGLFVAFFPQFSFTTHAIKPPTEAASAVLCGGHKATRRSEHSQQAKITSVHHVPAHPCPEQGLYRAGATTHQSWSLTVGFGEGTHPHEQRRAPNWPLWAHPPTSLRSSLKILLYILFYSLR